MPAAIANDKVQACLCQGEVYHVLASHASSMMAETRVLVRLYKAPDPRANRPTASIIVDKK